MPTRLAAKTRLTYEYVNRSVALYHLARVTLYRMSDTQCAQLLPLVTLRYSPSRCIAGSAWMIVRD
jgi:hypothetical protein